MPHWPKQITLTTVYTQIMTLKLLRLTLFASVYISINSCDRYECLNSNPTFDKFSPDADEYKSELAKQIKKLGAENLTYWHERYVKKDGRESIVVHIQGRGLCAEGEIVVTNWDKLSGMRREISGYRGARLKGLKFEIIQDSAITNFFYKDIDRIID